MSSGNKVGRSGQREKFNLDEEVPGPQLIPGEAPKLGWPFPGVLNGGEKARLCSSLRTVIGWVRHLLLAKGDLWKGTSSQCLAVGEGVLGI